MMKNNENSDPRSISSNRNIDAAAAEEDAAAAAVDLGVGASVYWHPLDFPLQSLPVEQILNLASHYG